MSTKNNTKAPFLRKSDFDLGLFNILEKKIVNACKIYLEAAAMVYLSKSDGKSVQSATKLQDQSLEYMQILIDIANNNEEVLKLKEIQK